MRNKCVQGCCVNEAKYTLNEQDYCPECALGELEVLIFEVQDLIDEEQQQTN